MASNHAITDDDRPTRDRLLEAGMALIAAHGFTGVSVGEIEAAAGLAPRRGALYKHFPSKQALVEAAMEERIAGVLDLSGLVAWFATPAALVDRRSSLRLIAEAALEELSREKHLNQIVEKDGDRFPELRDRMRTDVVEPGYRYAEEALAAMVDAVHGPDSAVAADIDVPAVAAVVLGALVHHRRQEWLLGAPPNDITTERFLDTLVEVTLRALKMEE